MQIICLHINRMGGTKIMNWRFLGMFKLHNGSLSCLLSNVLQVNSTLGLGLCV